MLFETVPSTNLGDVLNKRVGALSGGMIRRLGIAQAVLTNPILLLVDEPTAGLDPEECIRFRLLLRHLSTESIVLFSTHIVEDLSASDKVCVINNGKCCCLTTPEEMTGLADGHVRESIIPVDAVTQFIKGKVIVKTVSQNNGVYLRWLEKEVVANSPRPCAEDGYIWVTNYEILAR